MKCRKCGESKPTEDFARNTSRGKPILTLCKLCVGEQAKLSFREKRFGVYVARLRDWHDVQLLSEEAWLEARLRAVRDELRRRQ